MKALKIIAIGLLLLVAAVVIIGLFLPAELKVTERRVIKAENELIFNLVNDVKFWRDWSPWAEKDPAILIKFGDISVGEGATYEWISKDRNLGSGNMKITRSIPYELIATAVDFGNKGENNATGEFNFSEVPEGTAVSWTFYSDFGSNVLARYFGLAFKAAIADDYRRGLYKLDSMAATLKKPEARLGEISEVDLGGVLAIVVKDSCIADHVARRFAQNDLALRKLIIDQGEEVKGRPFAIWYKRDNENCVFELGIPITKPFEPAAPFTMKKIGGIRALRVQYFGPYRLIGLADDAAEQWLDSTKRKIAGATIEVYMSDPNNTPEADLQTDVFYPLD